MPRKISDISMRQAATIAGIAILAMTIAAIVATDLTIGRLLVQNDAVSTTENIMESKFLFRAGVFSWLIILVCDVLAAWGLYIFVKPVHRSLSLGMAWFRLVYAALLGTALFNLIEILLLVRNDYFLIVFGTEQFQSQVFLHVNAFNDMWSAGLIVFGIHIYLLGYLIHKSDYIPKILGILLILAFPGYLLTNLMNLFLPEYESYKAVLEWIFIVPMLGEVALGIWLLVKGIAVEQNT